MKILNYILNWIKQKKKMPYYKEKMMTYKKIILINKIKLNNYSRVIKIWKEN